jgi:hypothetical protein
MQILSAGASVATQLLEGTSSTVRVQQMVQLSLTPVFLLAALGAFLNVINQRLGWLVDRIHALEALPAAPAHENADNLQILRKRRKFAHLAINLSTGAGLLICIVVGLTFVSAFVKPALGNLVAFCWIVATMAVFGALLSFLLETQLASRPTRRIS